MLKSNSKSLENHVVSPEEEKERLQWEWFTEKGGLGFKGTLHSVEKTLVQKAYCVYYYILKERRFFFCRLTA